MLIGLATGGEGVGEQESHSKVGTLLGPTIISCCAIPPQDSALTKKFHFSANFSLHRTAFSGITTCLWKPLALLGNLIGL